jgi:hypothetical protein
VARELTAQEQKLFEQLRDLRQIHNQGPPA